MHKYLLLFVFFLHTGSISAQTTRNVPAQYSTIQTALNAAQSGDTVLVQPGTYKENIIWPSTNGIKLFSSADSSITIIDGDQKSSAIIISTNNIVDTTTIIHGFKIANGGGVQSGGGIAINKSNPTIENCWITNNYASNSGGGIYCTYSKPKLLNIRIDHNRSSSTGGGISCMYSADPSLKNIIIQNNNAGYSGGGLFAEYASPILDEVIIAENTAPNGGGIGFNNSTKAFLSKVSILYNEASVSCGGIYTGYNCDPTILHSNIIENKGILYGGIDIWGGTGTNHPVINNSNFLNNGFGFYNFDNTTLVNAQNNWWGHQTGPYHSSQNPSGKGDIVSNFVNFLPFSILPDTIAPPIPVQNVKIIGSNQNSISIAWDSSFIGDLSGYNIYYNLDSTASTYVNKIDVGNVTSYAIPNLVTGKKYYFKVTCYDIGNNESWYSKTISAITTPSARISSNVDTLLFGQIDTYILKQKNITITNDGTADLVISSITTNNSTFTVNSSSYTITPGSNKNIIVSFYPTNEKLYIGNLIIQSNAINSSTFIIPLKGFGSLPTTPKIFSVNDIPNDQGGFVRIKFQRSRYDGIDSTKKINTYTVWRKFDTNSWDALGYFNAIQDSIYYYVAPTLGDSTITSGIYWTTYRVSAHTSDPDIFFMSDSSKGYSVDNLIPHIPTGLGGSTNGNNVIIVHWNKNTDPDIQYYKVFRDIISGFATSSINFQKNTIDTIYVDSTVTKNRKYYYRLVAVDFAGNNSNASAEFSVVVTDVMSQTALPHFFSLDQNYPNPFNPSTTIQYGLPSRSAVRIVIYDVLGRTVSDLVNTEQQAGIQSAVWNANASSGLYFYRLEATSKDDPSKRFVETKKMLLLK